MLVEGQTSKAKAQEVHAIVSAGQTPDPVPPAYLARGGGHAHLPAYDEDGAAAPVEDDGFGAMTDLERGVPDDELRPCGSRTLLGDAQAADNHAPHELPVVAGRGIGVHAYYANHGMPVVLRIGPDYRMNRGAIALVPGSKQIQFRWGRGPAWSRTRNLYDGDGEALLHVKRYSIIRRGFWAATDPASGDTMITLERNAFFPLGLRIKFRNVFESGEGKSEAQVQAQAQSEHESQPSEADTDRMARPTGESSGTRSSAPTRTGSSTGLRLTPTISSGERDRPEVPEPATELQAKFTPWRGWSVTSLGGKVFAEYSKQFGHDYDMTGASYPSDSIPGLSLLRYTRWNTDIQPTEVAPHCDTLIAAFCGMIFREIEVGMRQSTNSGLVDLARKGVAMASSRR